MWNLSFLSATRAARPRVALALICLAVAQSAFAGDFDRSNSALYSGTAIADPSAGPDGSQPQGATAPPNLRLRNTLIIGTGAVAIAAYGKSNWWRAGFGGGFRTVNEGWFGRSTQYGGADKAGHMFSNYASVRLLRPAFEVAGNDPDTALWLAAWSTLGISTGVEVVDGFSRRWKFSAQDEIMNLAGTALGVVLETHLQLDAMLDFRIDYRRSPFESHFNPFGDYSKQKYLFVLKADGFEPLRENSVLRYLEVAAGYGTRGYDNGGERHRDSYIGISLNLSRLLADAAYNGRLHTTAVQRGMERLFELVQFPTIAYASRTLE